ncbi:putative stage V sporulation protein E [Limosilactobacillus coleohominis 101-4-CHN]|uniref:Probable peptidoglycan glycosyltransferase FtsW n=2 Tax=Limosilactobacillus coleohominis TaxID=181675 RepID=C7XTF9_9LACO|nr:putative stage V sporulation protein E [Limosilactobacillus coleohominis 101-4-CHN]
MRTTMQKVLRKIKQLDPWIAFPYLGLCIIGIIMVYSASAGIEMQNGGSPTGYLIRQAIFVVMGITIAMVVAMMRLAILRHPRLLMIFFAVLLVMLLYVKIFGAAVNGAQGWINLGFFSIQPAEIAKLFLIMYLANQFAHYNEQVGVYNIWSTRYPLIITALLLILILIQPDFGGFAINSAIVIVMFLGSEINWRKGVQLLLAFLAAIVIGLPLFARFIVNHFHGYQVNRFVAYINPFGNNSGVGNQLVNSYYAISNGGLTGVGLGNSIQKMGYLPEPNTDFILAIISEEMGWLMVAVILILMMIIVCRTIQLGVRVNSLYQALLCYGVATFIAVETFFNVGGVSGLLPITGVTLPFISYGGSSMLVLSAAIGLVLNVSRLYRQHK